MASVTVILRKNKPKPNNEFPLYLRIIKNRKSVFESLGINVLEVLWDDVNKRVKGKYPNSARVNNIIAKKIAEANDKVLELDGKAGGVKQIKKELSQKVTGSFVDYFNEYLGELERAQIAGTHRKSKSILKKMTDYNKQRDISFNELDLQFLKNYEKHLRKLGNSTNTIHANFRVIRMLLNRAVKEDVILIQNNPFQKFKSKKESVEKIFLTENELNAFESISISGPTQKIHQDMFVFACYTGGIRISDLLKLKWENFDGKHINIFIQKTKNHLSISVPTKGLIIINKYKPKDEDQSNGYIFPILKNGDDLSKPQDLLTKISSATAHANKNLKSFAKIAKIEKTITFHSSRHTWATRALSKGMPVTHVSKLMGHANLQVTMGYAKIVNKDLDDAMEVFN